MIGSARLPRLPGCNARTPIMLSHLTITDVQRGVNAHPGIADFRLPIVDCRYSKLETRNSKLAGDAAATQWSRVSIFEFRFSTSTIANQQSTIVNRQSAYGCRAITHRA